MVNIVRTLNFNQNGISHMENLEKKIDKLLILFMNDKILNSPQKNEHHERIHGYALHIFARANMQPNESAETAEMKCLNISQSFLIYHLPLAYFLSM